MQFPEHYDDIEGCSLRAVVEQSGDETDGGSRYSFTGYPEISNGIGIYKLFHRKTAFVPKAGSVWFCRMAS